MPWHNCVQNWALRLGLQLFFVRKPSADVAAEQLFFVWKRCTNLAAATIFLRESSVLT